MGRGPYYDPGRYWGKVTNQQLGQTSTGKPQIVISFTVLGKVNPADPEGELLPCGANYERSVFRVITDKTAEWASQDLAKLGFTGERFSDVNLSSTTACDMRGNEAAFYCVHDEHEGKVREKWQVASDGGGLEVKPLDAKESRQLDAMFGKFLKKNGKSAATPATKKAPLVGGPLTTEARSVLSGAKVNTDSNADANAAFQDAAAESSDDIPF